MSTLTQKAGAKELSDIVRKSGVKVTLGELLRKAGYSKRSSEKPGRIINAAGFQKEVAPLIQDLETERTAVISALKKKRGRAGYGTLVMALDTITKNIQLLKGRATGRLDLTFDPDEEAEVEKLLRRNAK